MLTAITGVNWGDEGKGRMVDLLSRDYEVVVRYQGGNNAGHTVVNERGKFILNLLPSGVLREDVVNVMGPGMVIDLAHLCGELDRLSAAGIRLSPRQLKISDKAVICLPYHPQQDCLEEVRLGDAKYGSTRRGIAPVYGDKYLKKAAGAAGAKVAFGGYRDLEKRCLHGGVRRTAYRFCANLALVGDLWGASQTLHLRCIRLFGRGRGGEKKHSL